MCIPAAVVRKIGFPRREVALGGFFAVFLAANPAVAVPTGFDDSFTEDDFRADRGDDGNEGVGSESSWVHELSLSDPEIRSHFTRGVAFAVGTTAPWQMYTVDLQYHLRPHVTTSFYGGMGHWDYARSRFGESFDLEVKSQAIGGGVRWYFTDVVGFFVQGDVGYAFWRGYLNPSGTDTEARRIRLDTSYFSSGPFLGAAIGIATWWESGFFLEYGLFGISKSWIAQKTFSGDDEEAPGIIREEITSPVSWGLVNIKTGYFF